MKKVLLIALALVILIGASVLWVVRGMGVSDPARLVPGDTVALLSLPDLPRTFFRWPQTALAKIGVEPQVKAFLEKPMQFLTQQQGGNEATGILWQLKPGRVFAAAVEVSGQDAAVLIGFQYWGGKTAHDAAVNRLRQYLAGPGATVEVAREQYQGTEIVSSRHGSLTLFNASHGQWGFLTNNLSALQAALDRASGRTKECLSEAATYRQVTARLDNEPDVLIFVQPADFVDALVGLGQTVGATPNPTQVEAARSVKALGFTTKLDGLNIRDKAFVLRPSPPDGGSLSHDSIRLTTPSTMVFFDAVVSFPQLAGAMAQPTAGTLLPGVQWADSPLLKLGAEAFGPDVAAAATWPENQFQPVGAAAVRVRDAAKAETFLAELTRTLPGLAASERNGATVYSLGAAGNPFFSPMATLTDGFLLLGWNEAGIDQARQDLASRNTLENSPVFAPARATYRSANEVFAYVDARALFQRGYPFVQQMLTFGVAFMPGLSDVVDPAKLPDTETVARHLDPIVYAQTRVADGYLIESTGPITLHQAVLLGAGVGSVFLKPPQ